MTNGPAPLGLGLAALGRPAYLNLGHGSDVAGSRDVSALRSRAHEVLDAAWELGIRHVDAARSYGLAERFLGSWLEAHTGRPSALTIGSSGDTPKSPTGRSRSRPTRSRDEESATFERQWPEQARCCVEPWRWTARPSRRCKPPGTLLEPSAGEALGGGVRAGLPRSSQGDRGQRELTARGDVPPVLARWHSHTTSRSRSPGPGRSPSSWWAHRRSTNSGATRPPTRNLDRQRRAVTLPR